MAIYNFNFQTANGNITANTTSYIVTGNLTNFIPFNSGSALLTANGNIVIGKVMHVTSNSSLVLANFATIDLTNEPFAANVFTISEPAREFGYNPGTISTNSNNNVIYGSGTFFSNSITTGDNIMVVNAASISHELINIGTVDMVDTNTRLYLRSNSTLSGLDFQFVNGNDYSLQFNWKERDNKVLGKEPDGFFNIINPMLDAVDAGVFKNAEQVQSYHPPIQDPVTGVWVNVPATTFQRHDGILGNVDATVSISSLKVGGENQLGLVKHFDVSPDKLGSHPAYVRDAVPYLDQLHDALTSPVSESEQGFFNHVSTQVYPETVADRYAAKLGRTVPRITDDHAQAVAYLAQQPGTSQLTDAEKQNLTATGDKSFRQIPNTARQLKASGVPVSIPGLINAVNDIQDSGSMPAADFKPVVYTVPQFGVNK